MEDLLIHQDKSLLNALELIQINGKRAIFVVDNKKRLKGIITDGDVRKFLLTGQGLSAKVSEVMNSDLTFGYIHESQADLFKKFQPEIKIIPLVNRANEVVSYLQWDKDIHIPVASPNFDGKEFAYLTEAFLSTWISSKGKYIDRFEQDFAKFCGSKYGVATSSGTTALHLALLALDIKQGDEVIVPDLTFAATINAVLHINAKPVIVDIEPDYWTIDPEEIRKAITTKTKAIIPVHIYGQPCNMKEIAKIAQAHDLRIIEDAAQAHGATYKNKKVGSFGDIGCFSFFGNKVITTGEGGMCVTNSETLYNKMRLLRDHGMSQTKKYWHDVVGFNYRMTNLQAAIGCGQLENIGNNLENRKKLEDKYRQILNGIDFIEMQKTDPSGDRKKITWLLSVLLKNNRDELLEKLQENNIDARPFFYPLSSMPIYKEFIFSNKNSKIISQQGINLPTQLNLNEEIINKIKKIAYEL